LIRASLAATVDRMETRKRQSVSRNSRIGEFRRRKTLPFTGYADEVPSLYSGMDLRKNF